MEKTYAYDKNGELTESRDSFSGQRQYQYDAAGRLLSSAAVGRVSSEFERLGRSNSAARQAAKKLLSEERFTYDAASNLMATGTDGDGLTIRPTRPEDFGGISPSRDGRAASFVKHNRLTAFEGFSFKYDRLGRTIEKTHLDTNRKWRFNYNSEDQLTSVQTVKGSTLSLIRFKYDALGRRTAKTDGRHETRFTWSMMRLLEEKSGDTKSTYVYEQGGYVPLARIDAPNEDWYAAEKLLLPKDINGIYYFHNNASGQPEEMTDRDGKIVWRGRYSAWGQLLYEEAPRGFVQNLRMQGQYHDREIGLHYNTFRYYDADTGRFTTEDPIGLMGGLNLYQYAPNPIVWIDPWGWAKGCGNKGKGTGKQRGPKRDKNAPHNKKIREIGDRVEAEEGGTLIAGGGKKERLIKTPGGNKSGRRPDVLYEDASGTQRGINVGRTKTDGSPVKREQQALDDLNGPGKIPTTFEPYD